MNVRDSLLAVVWILHTAGAVTGYIETTRIGFVAMSGLLAFEYSMRAAISEQGEDLIKEFLEGSDQ